ncbi:hypothetical protein Neosp_002984 [[Neocosmospora] mangrovei]
MDRKLTIAVNNNHEDRRAAPADDSSQQGLDETHESVAQKSPRPPLGQEIQQGFGAAQPDPLPNRRHDQTPHIDDESARSYHQPVRLTRTETSSIAVEHGNLDLPMFWGASNHRPEELVADQTSLEGLGRNHTRQRGLGTSVDCSSSDVDVPEPDCSPLDVLAAAIGAEKTGPESQADDFNVRPVPPPRFPGASPQVPTSGLFQKNRATLLADSKLASSEVGRFQRLGRHDEHVPG